MIEKAGEREEAVDLASMGKGLCKQVTAIEEALYQTKSKSPQDPLNFPIKLNNKLGVVAGTVSRGDYPPTDGARRVADELTAAIDAELHKLSDLEGNELKAFNALATKIGLNHVVPRVKKPAAEKTDNDK